jgi:outer membrane protein assembly factor BamB
VTDGERIYAYFGTAGLMCCDLKGSLLWVRKDLPYESVYGVGTSPIVCEGIVVVASDMPKEWGYLWGLDCKTGKLLWTKRWPGNPRRLSGNSRTPIVKSINGRKAVLVWRDGSLTGYELQSGEQVWSYFHSPGRSSDSVASLASDHERLYLSETAGTVALALDKLSSGQAPVLWEHKGAGANVSSPVLARGMLFVVTDGGIASCLEAVTGEVLWHRRLKGQYHASLVASSEFVYFLNSKGLTTVIACDRTFRKVAENDLGEDSFASIAPLEKQLLIRAVDHLYCIEKH